MESDPRIVGESTACQPCRRTSRRAPSTVKNPDSLRSIRADGPAHQQLGSILEPCEGPSPETRVFRRRERTGFSRGDSADVDASEVRVSYRLAIRRNRSPENRVFVRTGRDLAHPRQPGSHTPGGGLQPLEGRKHFGSSLITECQLLFQGLQDDVFQACGQGWVELGGPHRLPVLYEFQRFRGRGALKCQVPFAISYTCRPGEQSERSSTGSPRACSGDT